MWVRLAVAWDCLIRWPGCGLWELSMLLIKQQPKKWVEEPCAAATDPRRWLFGQTLPFMLEEKQDYKKIVFIKVAKTKNMEFPWVSVSLAPRLINQPVTCGHSETACVASRLAPEPPLLDLEMPAVAAGRPPGRSHGRQSLWTAPWSSQLCSAGTKAAAHPRARRALGLIRQPGRFCSAVLDPSKGLAGAHPGYHCNSVSALWTSLGIVYKPSP